MKKGCAIFTSGNTVDCVTQVAVIYVKGKIWRKKESAKGKCGNMYQKLVFVQPHFEHW
jgi:hypothetical protein